MGPGAPNLQDRRWRLSAFATLYLYQGLAAGFATTALANHFAGIGASTDAVGLHLTLVGLPWVLQPMLWGPLLDRAGPRAMGASRFWLVVGLLGAQASLGGLLLVGSAPDLRAVSLVLALHSLFASLADTATDRLIAARVPDGELGRTSAGTRTGFVAGSAIGTALFAWLLNDGFRLASLVLWGMTSLLACAAALVREAPGDALFSLRGSGRMDAHPAGLARALVGQVLQAARTRAGAALLALCFGIDLGLALFQVPFARAMVQGHGWEAAALSQLQAGLALVGGTLGAVAVGVVVDRAGPARGLVGLLLACAGAFAGIAGLLAAGLAATAGPLILALSSVIPALLYVALLPTVVLTSRRQGVSATQFQIFMAAMNLGDVAGTAMAGAVERGLGPLLTAGGLALLFLAFAVARAPAIRPG